jgi:hypothetical protein
MFMMWQANLASTIHIMKALSSLLNAFMKKSTFMMETAISHGLGMKRLRTSKARGK